jgi:hypothetical protein
MSAVPDVSALTISVLQVVQPDRMAEVAMLVVQRQVTPTAAMQAPQPVGMLPMAQVLDVDKSIHPATAWRDSTMVVAAKVAAISQVHSRIRIQAVLVAAA